MKMAAVLVTAAMLATLVTGDPRCRITEDGTIHMPLALGPKCPLCRDELHICVHRHHDKMVFFMMSAARDLVQLGTLHRPANRKPHFKRRSGRAYGFTQQHMPIRA